MNSDFFMTLPSNAKFDGNTTANFKVRLPQNIILDGSWEVALVEIMYPHSWYNVTGKESSDALDTDMHPNSFYIWIHDHILGTLLGSHKQLWRRETTVDSYGYGIATSSCQRKEPNHG